jgi:hypothetical protein
MLPLIEERKEVDGACSSRRLGYLGSFFTHERIQKAGFTDIRTAKKRNLRHARSRELLRRQGRK